MPKRARRGKPRSSPPDRPSRSRHPTEAGPCRRNAPSAGRRRSPPPPRQNPPARGPVDAPAVRTSRGCALGTAERNPSPPCSHRHSHARRANARISAWPCAAASPALSGPPPGSGQSPAATAPASASPPASCACSPAAARTGTSWQSYHGSGQRPSPPHADCSLPQTQNGEPLRRPPRQTSLAAPKRATLSNGRFLHRRAQQNAGAPLAWFVTAMHKGCINCEVLPIIGDDLTTWRYI